MIKIGLDEGFAFDLLSIADVKCENNPEDIKAQSNFVRLYRELSNEIGENLMREIYSSDEYKSLYKINGELYNLIDENKELRKNGKPVIDPDPKNYERWEWKVKLQEKFFPKIDFSEQKFGYK